MRVRFSLPAFLFLIIVLITHIQTIMKLYKKIAPLFLALAGVVAPLEAATATLPAEAVQLIQNSKSLEVADLAELLHELTLNSPECADQILALALSLRESWSDAEIATLFGAVVSAIPETRAALAQVPEEVASAIETGVVNTDVITNEMGVALLNVIAESASIDDEQKGRVSTLIADTVVAINDAVAVNRLANGELSDGTDDAIDELTQAKENPSSNQEVVEEFFEAQDDSSADGASPDKN